MTAASTRGEASLPWIVTGPNLLGRDYRVLAQSPGLTLTAAELSRINSFNLAAAAAGGPQEPSFSSFFPLGDAETGRWLLARSSAQRDDFSGGVVTWALVLDAELLDRIDWAAFRLLPEFPLGRPTGDPPPLPLPELLPPDDEADPAARDAAEQVGPGRFLVEVDQGRDIETFAVAVMEEVWAYRRAHKAWSSSGALAAIGFDPETQFDWIFMRRGGRRARDYAGFQRLGEGKAAARSGPPELLADATWRLLYRRLKGQRLHLPPTVFEAVSALRGKIDPSQDPAFSVGFLIHSIHTRLELDHALELFRAVAAGTVQFPAERAAERAVASQALGLVLRDYVESSDPATRADILSRFVFLADVDPAQTDTLVDLALEYHLLRRLPEDVVVRFAPQLAAERAAPQVRAGLERWSQAPLLALAEALAASWNRGEARTPTVDLAAALVARGVELGCEAARPALAILLEGLGDEGSWWLNALVQQHAPEVVLGRVGAARLRSRLRRNVVAAFAPGGPIVSAPVLVQRLIVARAAIEWAAR
jgi:hypothetical protein